MTIKQCFMKKAAQYIYGSNENKECITINV